jgi:hypothetical protein
MSKIPKIFISYAHDTEQFADKVLAFANKLRENLIDANIDQYEECPPQGWPRWMENEIDNADFVLVICTSMYYNRVKLYTSGEGKGVNWELNIIYQHLYENCCSNLKFIPVIFNECPSGHILKPLQSSTYYYVDREKDFKKLCNRIKGIKNTVKPPLGENEPDFKLELKRRKNMFVTSFIDVETWNKAGWGAVAYSFDTTNIDPPVLALTFENTNKAEKIFRDWKDLCKEEPFDDLEVSIIEGPLEGVGDGYFLFISTNIDRCIKRAENQGYLINETMLMVISRFQHMQPSFFSNNLNMFKKQYALIKEYYIAPAYFKSGTRSQNLNDIEIKHELKIKMRNIRFLKVEDLTPNDQEYIVTQAPNRT